MKKKILSTLLMFSFLFAMIPTALANDIKVTLNGEAITFDQPPIIDNGRTLVPLRAIFEALDAEVTWDDSIKTATAIKDNYSVSITIDDNNIYKDDAAIPLDVPAKIVNGRTLVPARAIAESFGCEVNWNSENKTVEISAAKDNSTFETFKNFLVENGKNDNNEYVIKNDNICEETDLVIRYNSLLDTIQFNLIYYDLNFSLTFNNKKKTADNDIIYVNIKLRDSEPTIFSLSKNDITSSNKITSVSQPSKNFAKRLSELYDEYTIGGSTEEIDIIPVFEGIMAHSNVLFKSEGLDLNPYSLCFTENTTTTNPKTTRIYNASGGYKSILVSQMKAYLKNGWHAEPVITMYALDGRTQVVPKSKIEANKKVGWYETPFSKQYSVFGTFRDIIIANNMSTNEFMPSTTYIYKDNYCISFAYLYDSKSITISFSDDNESTTIFLQEGSSNLSYNFEIATDTIVGKISSVGTIPRSSIYPKSILYSAKFEYENPDILSYRYRVEADTEWNKLLSAHIGFMLACMNIYLSDYNISAKDLGFTNL